MARNFIIILLALVLCPFLTNDWNVDIKEYDVPKPNSRPHDPTVTPDGALWYTGQLANKLWRLSESGVKPNTLVAFDPKTKKFQTWPIPSGGGVVRNMVATPDDRLYLACSGVNKVAIVKVSR